MCSSCQGRFPPGWLCNLSFSNLKEVGLRKKYLIIDINLHIFCHSEEKRTEFWSLIPGRTICKENFSHEVSSMFWNLIFHILIWAFWFKPNVCVQHQHCYFKSNFHSSDFKIFDEFTSFKAVWGMSWPTYWCKGTESTEPLRNASSWHHLKNCAQINS